MLKLFTGILGSCLIFLCGVNEIASQDFEADDVSITSNYSCQLPSPEVTSQTNFDSLSGENCEYLNNPVISIESEPCNDIDEAKNVSRTNEREQTFGPSDVKFNISFEQLLPDFFISMSTQKPPQKYVPDVNTNDVLSAVDALKNMFTSKEFKTYSNSTNDNKEWKNGLNSNLGLFKAISKNFFPIEQNILPPAKPEEKEKELDNYFHKILNYEAVPASTERYSTGNGTVKVYVGKWDLEKSNTNQLYTEPFCLTEPTNLRSRSTVTKRSEKPADFKNQLSATTEKATVHFCNKCSKKWSIALSEIENESEVCTCTSKRFRTTPSIKQTTPYLKETTSNDFNLLTKSDVYFEFMKILEAFSITSERAQTMNELPPTKLNNLFISEPSTKKPLIRKTTPVDKYNLLKHSNYYYPSTRILPGGSTSRQATSTHPLLETELITNPTSTISIGDTVSPNKSKAHQELVKIFESLILSTANYKFFSESSTSTASHHTTSSKSVISSPSTENSEKIHSSTNTIIASSTEHHVPLTTVHHEKSVGTTKVTEIPMKHNLTTPSTSDKITGRATVKVSENITATTTEKISLTTELRSPSASPSSGTSTQKSVLDKTSVRTTVRISETKTGQTTAKTGSTTELRSPSPSSDISTKKIDLTTELNSVSTIPLSDVSTQKSLPESLSEKTSGHTTSKTSESKVGSTTAKIGSTTELRSPSPSSDISTKKTDLTTKLNSVSTVPLSDVSTQKSLPESLSEKTSGHTTSKTSENKLGSTTAKISSTTELRSPSSSPSSDIITRKITVEKTANTTSAPTTVRMSESKTGQTTTKIDISTESSSASISPLSDISTQKAKAPDESEKTVLTTSRITESQIAGTTAKIGLTTELRTSSGRPSNETTTRESSLKISSTQKSFSSTTSEYKMIYQTTNVYELKKHVSVHTTPLPKVLKDFTESNEPFRPTFSSKASTRNEIASTLPKPSTEASDSNQSTSPIPPNYVDINQNNATAVRLESRPNKTASTKGIEATTSTDSTTKTEQESNGSKEDLTQTTSQPRSENESTTTSSAVSTLATTVKPSESSLSPSEVERSTQKPKNVTEAKDDTVSSTATAATLKSITSISKQSTITVAMNNEKSETKEITPVVTVQGLKDVSTVTSAPLQVKPPSKITSSPFKNIYDSQSQPPFLTTKYIDECYSEFFKPLSTKKLSSTSAPPKKQAKQEKVTDKSKKGKDKELATRVTESVLVSSTMSDEIKYATTIETFPNKEDINSPTTDTYYYSTIRELSETNSQRLQSATLTTQTKEVFENVTEVSTMTTTETGVDEEISVTATEPLTITYENIPPKKTPGNQNKLDFPGGGSSTSFDFYGLEPYNSSVTVRQYVTDISEKAAVINNRNMNAQWNHETNITHKNYKIAMVSTLELIHYERIQNQYLDTLRDVPIYDPMLEREIKLLYLPGMSILPDIKIAVFEEMLYAMDTIYSSASVIAWNNPHSRYHLPEVKRAMSSSNIPEELSFYWTEWRNVTGRKLRRLYEQYVELMNLTAISNGFCDASEMWTRDYETEDFMQLMGCHWEEIRPLYLELHAFVRCKLHKHYGDVTMTNDYTLPIPAHLVGDLWGQSWKQLFNITRPYEKVYDYPTMDIRSKGYTTTKMALYAEAFFSSLGFPSLPESFWKNSILTKQKTDMSCEPTAWDLCDGKDFRIKMCSNGTLQDFFDIHHELTHVEYFIQYKDLSFPFRSGPNPGFHEALAGTILLSVGNPNHLSQVGLAPKSKAHNHEVDINYLLRVALDKVAFLPYSYIVDLWRYKVFKGDIKPNDYNKRWWELRLQYQGIAPPNQRTEEDFDPGCKFHIAGNKPYIQNFLSTILQFQFHEALCRRAGLITPKTPLHNCDISNSHEAGTILRRVMSMGATQHWRVAMNELTGTRQISSKGLVEYFKPLLTWLRKENMKTGQKIGWKNTNNLF